METPARGPQQGKEEILSNANPATRSAKRRLPVLACGEQDSESDDGLALVTFSKRTASTPHRTTNQQTPLHSADHKEDCANGGSKSTAISAGFDLDSLLQAKSKQVKLGTDLATLERVLATSAADEAPLDGKGRECEYESMEPSESRLASGRTTPAESRLNLKPSLERFDLFRQDAAAPQLSLPPLKTDLADSFRLIRDNLAIRRLLVVPLDGCDIIQAAVLSTPLNNWRIGDATVNDKYLLDTAKRILGMPKVTADNLFRPVFYAETLIVKRDDNNYRLTSEFRNRLLSFGTILAGIKTTSTLATLLILRLLIDPQLHFLRQTNQQTLEFRLSRHGAEEISEIIQQLADQCSDECKARLLSTGTVLPKHLRHSCQLVRELCAKVLDLQGKDIGDWPLQLANQLCQSDHYRIHRHTDFGQLFMRLTALWSIVIILLRGSTAESVSEKSTAAWEKISQAVRHLGGRIMDPKGAFPERTRTKELALMIEALLRADLTQMRDNLLMRNQKHQQLISAYCSNARQQSVLDTRDDCNDDDDQLIL